MINQALQSIGPYLLIAGVLILAIAMIAWRFARANALLDRWAVDNGFQIQQREHRWLRKGPFFFRSSDDQMVYYVVVMDRQGRERRGYVRVGGWFLGLFSNQVDARWED